MTSRDRIEPFAIGAEQRYPLDLAPSFSRIHALYEDAMRERWDPETVVRWAELASSDYPPSQRAAAALVWSHKAWLEYRGIRESETAIVRLCIEPGRLADAKYFLTTRGSAKAVATEAAWLAADSLGEYRRTAASTVLTALIADDAARRGLHVLTDPDGFVISQLFVSDVVDLACSEAIVAKTTDPVLAEVGRHLLKDKRRHVDFGREYAEFRLPRLAESGRLGEVDGLAQRTFARELGGLRCPGSLSDVGTDGFSDRLVAAYGEAAEAGLGGLDPGELRDVVRNALAAVALELAEFGVQVSRPDGGAGLPHKRELEEES